MKRFVFFSGPLFFLILLISLGLTAGFFILVPWNFDPYVAQVENTEISGETMRVYYQDLNHDGSSERIEYYPRFSSNSSILIRSKGRIIYQWNLQGSFYGESPLTFCDYDTDGIDEICVFTHHDDSLFCSTIEPFLETSGMKRVFIDRVVVVDGTYDYTIFKPLLYDIHGDATPELIFSVGTGYSLYPRKTFALNLVTDSVWSSEKSATAKTVGFWGFVMSAP